MAQIKHSPAEVTNGSQTVKLLGADYVSQIPAKSVFVITPDFVPYTVASAALVGADTVLTLTGAYQGATSSVASAVVTKDVTAAGIPTIAPRDVGTAAIFTEAMNRIQELINQISPGGLDSAYENAEAAAGKAQEWADNEQNIEVEPGKYSAKHWAEKAAESAADAASGGGDVTQVGVQTLSNKTLQNPAAKTQALVDGASVAWNCENGQSATLTLSSAQSARGIASPTNMKPGIYTLIVKQGASGGQTIASWGAAFQMTADVDPDTEANAVTAYLFVCDGTTMYGSVPGRQSAAAPAPTPAPPPASSATGEESRIVAMSSVGAFWHDPSTTSTTNMEGTVVTGDATITEVQDRFGSNHLQELEYQMFTGGSAAQRYISTWDPCQTLGGGGSGNAGFLFAAAVRRTSWGGTDPSVLFSDVPTASPNVGRRVFFDGDDKLCFDVGNGSTRTVIKTAASVGVGASASRFVCMAWDDGASIYVRLNNGQIFSTARPAVTAGQAVCGIMGTPGDAHSFEGQIYGQVGLKNTCGSQTDRDDIMMYLGAKIELALTPNAGGEPPLPLASYVVSAQRGTGYAFGARKEAYAAGILPTRVATAGTPRDNDDNTLRAHFDAWRAHALKDASWLAGGKFVQFSDPTYSTTSESLGYGMMLCVLFGDRTDAQADFDAMLKLVRNHPATEIISAAQGNGDPNYLYGNYLMAWKQWADGTDVEGWNAMDGDMDIAMALCMADKQWGTSGTTWNYAQEAANTIEAMKWWNFATDGTMRGQRLPSFLRSSDIMYNHFRAYEKMTGDTFWASATVSTEGKGNALARQKWITDHIQTNDSPSTGLMPDFVVHTDTSDPMPSLNYEGTLSLDVAENNPHAGDYDYNSCRVPMRFGIDYLMSNDATVRAQTLKISNFFKGVWSANGNDAAFIRDGYTLDGTSYRTGYSHAYGGPITVGAMVDSSQQAFLDSIYALEMSQLITAYYDGELQFMSMVAASGNWWKP